MNLLAWAGGPQLSPGHRIATTPDQLQEMVTAMRAQHTRGFDFETNGLRYGNGDHPIGYAIGYLAEEYAPRAWYVPVRHLTTEPQANEEAAKRAFRDALEGAPVLVGHNLKFDLNMGRANGYEIPEDAELHDTFIQSYLIYERRRHKLEALAESVAHLTPWGDAWDTTNRVHRFLSEQAKLRRMRFERDNKEAGEACYLSVYGHSEVPVALESEYSCRDVGHALLLDATQRAEAMGIGQPWEDQRRYLYWNEMLLVRALADMEYTGQRADPQYFHALAADIDRRLDTMGRDLSQQFGALVNWSNDNEVRDFLYNHLKLPVVRRTDKSKEPAVDRAAFLLLRPFHPGMVALAEYKAWLKARQTYTKSVAWFIDRDGKIRASFKQTGTKSGRLSSNSPNLQNIPIRHKETSRRIRQGFYVPEGWARIYADYSQIELRVLAHVTRCANLTRAYLSPAYDAYRRGELDYRGYLRARRREEARDVHGETTKSVFGTQPTAPEWKGKRRAAKAINFGVPYGMGPPGLMGNPELMLSEEEAVDYFAKYHRAHPEIAETKGALFRKMLSVAGTPYFVNWAGRAVHEPLLRHRKQDLRSEGERSAFASLIQGSAGELTRFSIVALYRARRAGRIQARATSTVHDEIQMDCEEAHVRTTARITRQEMEAFPHFGRIPVIADLEVTRTTWADKEDYA